MHKLKFRLCVTIIELGGIDSETNIPTKEKTKNEGTWFQKKNEN